MRQTLTIPEAAAQLGISETEVRRRIRAGTLEAEQFQRPQGVYYRVILDLPDELPEQPPTGPQESPSPAIDLPAILQAATAPLERALTSAQETISTQARITGGLAADLLAAHAEAARLRDELARVKARGWWERLRNR